MAWNPDPKVADCRDIARKWSGQQQVIIIGLKPVVGTIEMATYGETKAMCAWAKRLGNIAFNALVKEMEETGCIRWRNVASARRRKGGRCV